MHSLFPHYEYPMKPHITIDQNYTSCMLKCYTTSLVSPQFLFILRFKQNMRCVRNCSPLNGLKDFNVFFSTVFLATFRYVKTALFKMGLINDPLVWKPGSPVKSLQPACRVRWFVPVRIFSRRNIILTCKCPSP